MTESTQRGIIVPSPGQMVANGVALLALLRQLGLSADSAIGSELGPLKAELGPLKAQVQALLDAVAGPGQIDATDPVVTALVNDAGSGTRQALEDVIDSRLPVVSVISYGADPTGTTDSTQAIRDALDSGARVVVAPPGRYLVSDDLRVRSGQWFLGEGATLVSTSPALACFIRLQSDYDVTTKQELAAEAGVGTRTLTTKAPHAFQPGDVLRLVGQRVATSDEAGDWRMGWSTVNLNGPLFAEFVRVESVTSTTVTLDSGLIFPFYRPDSAQESAAGHGSSAYLIRTDGAGDRITVSGFTLEGQAVGGIIASRAHHATITGCRWVRPDAGRFVELEDCYHTEVRDCHVEVAYYDPGVDHAHVNVFHVAGSWHSGFRRCSSSRGTQNFDITYRNSSRYVSVGCYVKDCQTESSLDNPVTVHPGVYRAIISGNHFANCQKNGIGIRGNRSEVYDNIVTGSDTADTTGIYVYEGGGKGTNVYNNTVENFPTGLRLNDGSGKPFPDRIDVEFRGNTVRNFDRGWVRVRDSGAPHPSVAQGIRIVGNRFETDRANATGITTAHAGAGIKGLVIQDNVFHFNVATGGNAIEVTANSKDTLVKGNTFTGDMFRALTYRTSGYATATPDVVVWGHNHLDGVRDPRMFTPTATFQVVNISEDVLTTIDAPILDNFKRTGKWRTNVNAQVDTTAGFPVSSVVGWWEVIYLSDTSIVQKFYQEDSDGATKVYSRRLIGSSWSAWRSVTLT